MNNFNTHKMRGIGRLGALGLEARVRCTGPFQHRHSQRQSSSSSSSSLNSSTSCAASSSGSPQPHKPPSNPSTGSLLSSGPSRQLIATAALGGGALGAIAGAFVSNATKNGQKGDEAEHRGLQAVKSNQGEMRRLSSLRQQAIDQELEQSTSPVSAKDAPWYHDVGRGMTKILDAATLLQSDHPFLEDDHMFSAFLARGIINDIEGFYSKSPKEFKAVVALGNDVSGYAGIVHGGLTAAIFDEVFGGLLFCLKTKHLSLNPTHYLPSFTVNLQVDYRSRIRAGSTVLCRAWVHRAEGRKIIMKAEMKDGPNGVVYAESQAIFVRPKMLSFAADVLRWIRQRAFKSSPDSCPDRKS